MRRQKATWIVLLGLLGAAVLGAATAGEPDEESVEELLARAEADMEGERYRSAVSIYSSLLEEGRLHRSARLLPHYKRAQALSELGEHRTAVGGFSEALAILSEEVDRDDEKAQIHFDRGLAYDRLGEMKKAIADYSRCLDLASDHLRAYNNRAVAHYRTGKYREAIQDANSYLKQDPDWAGAYYTRGAAKIELKDPSAITDLKIAAGMGHEDAQNALRQADIDW